ncbi:MAG: hypothetical protein M1815_005597 [Lichina confinis]|nr:MAG: hypothetical protein M1815_005597 [Lichina confinis]
MPMVRPTGLSVNITQANTTEAPNQQQQGPMFGSTGQPTQGGGTAFGGSLFGQGANRQQQPQASSNLFGASSSQQTGGGFGGFGGQQQPQKSPQTGGFGGFGATQQRQQPQQSGVFGASQQQQPQQSGGFGATQQQQQPQQSGGFGALQQQQPQQLGAFGTSQQQQQQQPQQAQQAGGFGAHQTGNVLGFMSTQTGGGSSGFGGLLQQPQQPQPPQQQQQQQQGAQSFFNRSAQPQQNVGGFGQTQQPQQQHGANSLFNRPAQPFQNTGLQPSVGQAQQPARRAFGLQSSTANRSLQTQTPGPFVKIDLDHVRLTTRFTDLQEHLQKEIEEMDAVVLRQINTHNQCKAVMPTHEDRLTYLPNDVEHVTKRMQALTEALEADALAIDRVRATAKKDAHDAKLSFALIDTLKLAPQHQYSSLWGSPRVGGSGGIASIADTDEANGGPNDLVSFFSQRADGMSQKLEAYQRNLSEIESHLRTVESRVWQQLQELGFSRNNNNSINSISNNNGTARSAEDQLIELAGVLRDFEQGIRGVAGRVATVREDVQGLTLADIGGSKLDGRGDGLMRTRM